jgi:predicted metal-dependent peptidase
MEKNTRENQSMRYLWENTLTKLIDSSSSSNGNLVFYGHLLASFKLYLDEDLPSIAGVNFSKGRFNLFLKVSEFEKLTESERTGVLIHECLHIIFNHIARKKNREHKLWNIACDIAINQFIKNLPKGALYPEIFQFEKLLPAESYYNLLKKKYEDNIIKFNSDGTFTYKGKTYSFDPHDSMLDSEDVPEELIDLVKNQLIKRAEESSRGMMPSDIYEMISKQKSRNINWQKFLKKELSTYKTLKSPSIMKKNRRFLDRPEIYGTLKRETNNGITILDTSGSMSSEYISWALGEVENCVKSTHSTMTLIQNDTEVKSISEWKEKSNIEIKGRGGTHLEPAIKYINDKKLQPNFIIIITDGEIETHWSIKPNAKVLFLLPEDATLSLKNINFNYKILHLNKKN